MTTIYRMFYTMSASKSSLLSVSGSSEERESGSRSHLAGFPHTFVDSGHGKSTLALCLLRALQDMKGIIMIDGIDTTK